MIHTPVLLKEVLEILDPKPNRHFIDATIGEGGHAKSILEKTTPGGMLLGIDRDIQQIERARKELSKFQKRIIFINDSFGNLSYILEGQEEVKGISWQGIIFDLGWSQAQIEGSGRGLSFTRNEPLDMRYGRNEKIFSAEEIVNKWRREDIEGIIRDYGEERFAKGISEGIVRSRKEKSITTTFQLADIIKKATPSWYHHRRIHAATKTFQALRIAVNDEYGQIEKGLRAACSILAKKGTIVAMSFHSGEDRVVKNCFKTFSSSGLGIIITKKPIRPSEEEIKHNPHSRSAKLRAFKVT